MSQAGNWRRRQELFDRAFEFADDISTSVLLSRILDLAGGLAEAQHGFLVILDPDGEVQAFVTSGAAQERRRLDRAMVDAGILGQVVNEGRVVRLAGLADDPSLVGFPRSRGFSPVLGVPLTVWGKVCGAVCLGRSEGSPEFDEEAEQQMTLLGAHAGVALDHARLLQRGRVRERARAALDEVSKTILGGSAIDHILQLVARSGRELASADMAFVNTPDETGEILVLRAAAGERAEPTVGMTFARAGSMSGEVMSSRRPVLVRDSASDQRVNQPLVRVGHIGPALFVPLAVGDHLFGTMCVANEVGGRRFGDDDLLLLQIFAAEAAVALQYGHIRAELERLSLLEERERIAMDLHDGVIQALFVVGLSLQAAQEVAQDADEVAVRLADAVGSIDRSIRDLRDYIFGLQPDELGDHQLERALRDVAAVFQRSGRVATLVKVDPKAAALLAPHTTPITQIAREAMSNAVRHSGGALVTLVLEVEDGEAVLAVSDDGSGFDPDRVAGQGHGLTNLRARAEALGGVLEIDSEPGAGTTLRIRVPV
jgi:signal transduction histidine kinase